MNGLVEIVDAGIGNSLQDLGRFGFRHMGIAVSGCLDSILARCANALVGNPADCACIEVRAAGPALTVRQGRVRFALAGEITATRVSADGREEELKPWRSISLEPGETLQVGFLSGGAAYLAINETPDNAGIELLRDSAGKGLLTVRPFWAADRGRLGYARRIRYVFFDGGGHVETAFFTSLFDYIDQFMDRAHHAKEDSYLFPSLLRRAPEAAAIIERLQVEHHNGPDVLRDLRAKLAAPAGGATAGR